MPDRMTVESGADVAGFLDHVEPARRRTEGKALARLFKEVTGLEPRMWGVSIVGYGRYSYRYRSGHSGQSFLTGFAPRKAALTIYIMPGFDAFAADLGRLGPHRLAKSCLYVTRLERIDEVVLGGIVARSVDIMRRRYGVQV